MVKIPAVPRELGPRGRKFWRTTLAVIELDPDSMELFREACRTLDSLDALSRAIREDGTTIRGSEGQPRLHPAFAEIRGARALLGRLLKMLDLPYGEEERPTEASQRAREAAQERWRMERERRHRAGA